MWFLSLSLSLSLIFIAGSSSNFITPLGDSDPQNDLLSDFPSYYDGCYMHVIYETPFDDSDLVGINQATYDTRLKPAILDFIDSVADDGIEITAECFFSLLINWLVAHDQDLNSPSRRTQIYHQMNLSGSRRWGRPDLVLEMLDPNSYYLHAIIIELKHFARPWDEMNWETQLCSYLLGYQERTGVQAAGVISNMVMTKLYRCDLDAAEFTCECYISEDIKLFNQATLGGVPGNTGWLNFNHDYFFQKFAPFLKSLMTIGPVTTFG